VTPSQALAQLRGLADLLAARDGAAGPDVAFSLIAEKLGLVGRCLQQTDVPLKQVGLNRQTRSVKALREVLLAEGLIELPGGSRLSVTEKGRELVAVLPEALTLGRRQQAAQQARQLYQQALEQHGTLAVDLGQSQQQLLSTITGPLWRLLDELEQEAVIQAGREALRQLAERLGQHLQTQLGQLQAVLVRMEQLAGSVPAGPPGSILEPVLGFLHLAEQEAFRDSQEGIVNPKKLLGMLRRYSEQFRQALGLQAVAELGQEVAFDPAWHTSHDPLEVGQRVWVVRQDWRQEDRLVRKAEVTRQKPTP
jgi:hypothetical protein